MSELLAGEHLVQAVLEAGRRRVRRLILRKGAEHPFVGHPALKGVPVETQDGEGFARRVPSGRQVRIAVEADPYPYVDARELEWPAAGGLMLVLDHVEDPRNLGAILRTAGAAGVAGVVLPKDRAARLTPVAQAAAAGVAEFLQVALVPNLTNILTRFKEDGAWSYGLDMDGEDLRKRHPDPGERAVLVAGSEGRGLAALLRKHCDFLVCLDMAEGVESLNVSVATGLALYRMTGRI